jgi:ACS family sodium-dependent inorganic phosphate cotransporter
MFMVAAGYVMTKVAAITCLTVAVGIGGFAWSGFSVNHLDIAPQFAGILMGVSNTFATLPGIISPALVGAIVTDQVTQMRVPVNLGSEVVALSSCKTSSACAQRFD